MINGCMDVYMETNVWVGVIDGDDESMNNGKSDRCVRMNLNTSF